MDTSRIWLLSLTSLILASSFPSILGQEDGWGMWSDYSECSRTCGGGVQQSSRQCLNGRAGSTDCQGQRIQYQSCNTQECPSGTPDFRTYQCRTYNNVPQMINGASSVSSQWRPYYDPRAPCKLICQNEMGTVKTLRETVIDGTTCDNGNSFGVCIGSFCKPVGCDHKIGSVKSEDRCLVCGGTGENCQTIRGTTRNRDLKSGESSEVVTFPAGATKINIKLTSASPSALELKSDSGKTLRLTEATVAFGQRKIADFADTHFHYKFQDEGMEFTARGPVNETLPLMVRFQGQSPDVEFEYSIPKRRVLEKDPQQRYSWLFGGWTSCSEECGVGYQLRAVSCMDREEGEEVTHDFCKRHEMPDRNQTCNNGPCSNSLSDGYKWVPGHWGECSVNCGLGEQSQLMHCIETGVSGDSVYASDDLCTRYVGKKPVYQRACYGEDDGCPYWATGAWDECSVTCGYGRQKRQVYCQRDPLNPTEDPVVLKDSMCSEDNKPQDTQLCILEACLDGSNSDRDVVLTTRPKKVEQNCESSRFGCCRDNVTPAKGDNYYGCTDELTEVSDPCQQDVDKGGCVQYKVKWYYNYKDGECQRFWYGGCKGNLNRFDDRESCRKQCNKEKLTEVEAIRGCQQSRYKCCDDGVTYARGPNKAGCPERRLIGGCGGTRYGCCADGVTAARGRNKMGCPETRVGGCAGTRYGCCADGFTSARGENKLGCAENPVMGCKNSIHGCCEDQVTPATGPNRRGCPETRPIILGGCNSTRHGCCHDGVTAATGPDGQGCPAFDPASCGLPKAAGDCTNYSLKWHFNKVQGVCRPFWYGSCNGNGNRFDSTEECESKCVKAEGKAACRLPSVTGPCRAIKKRYFFDHEMGKCRTFTYGGCKGNNNNFHTLGECQGRCGGIRGDGTETVTISRNRACASMPCQNGFTCQDYHNGTYSCSCNPDWGVNCESPPDYWCFSDSECNRGLKCVRKRECNDGYCWVYARCSASLNRHVCDRPVCPQTQDCVNDESFEDGYFCIDQFRYTRRTSVVIGCSKSEYGCCSDGRTPATGPNRQGCRQRCEDSDYGCCRDGVTAADGPDFEGCNIEGSGDVPCERTEHGCCEDGVTAAAGPRGKGCGETTDSEERVNNGRPTQGGGGGSKYGKCMAPVTREFCTEYILKWRYDEQKQGCEQHWWGGCASNGNVFDSQEECEAECMSTIVTDPDNEDPDFINICDMPQDIGPCRASISRYYYDPRDRSCRVFKYGGCQGNENNFMTIEECQRECMGIVIREEHMTTTAAPTYTLAPPTGSITLSLTGDTTVEEGQELRVACQASGPIQVRLEWYINGQPIKSRTDLRLSGRSSVTSTGYGQVGELIILRARVEDSGTYYCQSSSGEVERMVISVTPVARVTSRPVTEAPIDVESSITISGNPTIRSGATLSITCRALGPRRPTSIDWFFKRQVVSPDSRSPSISTYADRETRNVLVSELTVVNAEKDNEGTYHCRSRPYGNVTQIEIRVDVDTVIQPDSSGSDDPADVCRQPKRIGRCRGAFPRFYFDFESGYCESFIFGGCQENKNNFMTMEACERKCAPYIKGSTRNEVEVDGDTSVCQLDPEKGKCRGYDIKWFYSAARNRCSRFVYTGCDGNGNRFDTQEECTGRCVKEGQNESGRRTRRPYIYTTRPPYIPPTRAPFTRAPITRAPVTRAPVTRAPQSPCSMPSDAGSKCGDWVLKWYYDTEFKRCRRFYYGGCDGNTNRFESEAECEDACRRRIPATRRPVPVSCYNTDFGCCDDGVTTAVDRLRSNCDNTNVIIQPGTRGDHTLVIVRPRADAVLQCNQRGQELLWYRDGFLLSSSRRFQIYNNGTLALRDVTDDMAGFYSCRVSDGNSIPRSQRFKVEVNVPLRILPGPALMSIKPGEDAFMHCQAQGSPEPRVSWDRNGRVLQSNGHFLVFGNGTLIIENVQVDDAGQYECSAENGVAPTVRRTVTVKIKESIDADIQRHKGIFMEGETIHLHCKSSGFPPPKLEWIKEGKVMKNGGKVSLRGGELSISSATIEDAGMYKCVSSNDRNKAEDITTVQIKFPTSQMQCEDTLRRTKCRIVVAGQLCGFRVYRNKCCASCRRAGYL